MRGVLGAQVGMFPDVAEALALGHWGRGDTLSALITAEWYLRRMPGWGRPFEFVSRLMQQAGRPEEARDTVSAACPAQRAQHSRRCVHSAVRAVSVEDGIASIWAAALGAA
jgi:hypothetical protein